MAKSDRPRFAPTVPQAPRRYEPPRFELMTTRQRDLFGFTAQELRDEHIRQMTLPKAPK